jgi:hypothetical protein
MGSGWDVGGGPQRGDVFEIPVGDDQVAYGQVLSEEEGVFVHLVVFEGLHDAANEHDLDEVLRAPVVLYAWTNARPFGRRWRLVDNRPIDSDALPRVEFVEMAAPEEFRVVDYDGNVLRPATAEEVENAPFRTMVSTKTVEEAVEAWHGRRPWKDEHLTLRPWDARNAERDDEAARLLRRFRGLDQAPAPPDPESAEKIHYFVFAHEHRPAAAEERLGELGDVRVDLDDSDDRTWLLTVRTTVAASPATAELNTLAEELGGEYQGSETELV